MFLFLFIFRLFSRISFRYSWLSNLKKWPFPICLSITLFIFFSFLRFQVDLQAPCIFFSLFFSASVSSPPQPKSAMPILLSFVPCISFILPFSHSALKNALTILFFPSFISHLFYFIAFIILSFPSHFLLSLPSLQIVLF